MNPFKILIVAACVALTMPAFARQTKTDTTKTKHHTHHMNGVEMDDMDMMDMSMDMNSQHSLDLPMSRDGSGTSWVPDASPTYAYMIHGKKWMTMIHGDIFMRYNKQDLFNSGSRGGSKFDAPSMIMAM